MRDALFLAGFVGFTSGILCRSFLFYSGSVLGFLVLVALMAVFVWRLRSRTVYLVCALFLVGAVLGSVRVMLVPEALPQSYESLLDTNVSLEGTIVAEPDIRETTQRVTIEVREGNEKTKVLAVAQLYPVVVYGEHVTVSGKLVLPEPFETDTGRTFRYDRFLAKDGIFALVERASIETNAPAEGMGAMIMGTLLSWKHLFQEGLARALPEPSASLASGLLTGGKQGLGTTLLDAFIVAGLVHIVVLSGYNVMIVAEGVLRAVRFLPKRAALAVAGLVIALFVLAAGAGSASIRAGFMAGLALLARATGRTYAVVRALLVVAALMLLANPLLLAYDPGFQLSFVATLGLILLSPLLEARLMFVASSFWRDLLAATLAAQIAVFPLLSYQMGLFSVVSLPANILVLPVVPLAMALSAVAGLIGSLVPVAATFVGLPAYLLLTYIIEATRFFASLPLAAVSIPQFPFVFVVMAYAGLAYWIAKATRTQASVSLRAKT